MTWVIRVPAVEGEPPEYLSRWDLSKSSHDPDAMVWRREQKWAHRFENRNEAVKVATSWPIEAYCDDIAVVKIRTKSPVAIVNESVGKDPKGSRTEFEDCG